MSIAPDSGFWAVEAEAPAKLNLALAVVGKRADGFHDLLTVFQAIDLRDRLWFRDRADLDIHLRVVGPESAPEDATNLVVRAAEALRTASGVRRGLDILLEKNIPAGTGLGGGSSDAAATLLALDQLWSLNAPQDLLARLALDLGSDVPFFLIGGTALGAGRGERLRALPPPPRAAYRVLVPDVRLSTRDVFSAISGELTRCSEKVNVLVDAIQSGSASGFFENLENDLLTGVVRIQPRLAQSLQELRPTGALALGLTGSGSAFFALFKSEGDADAALGSEFVRRDATDSTPGTANVSWRVYRCSPVPFGARVVPGTVTP